MTEMAMSELELPCWTTVRLSSVSMIRMGWNALIYTLYPRGVPDFCCKTEKRLRRYPSSFPQEKAQGAQSWK